MPGENVLTQDWDSPQKTTFSVCCWNQDLADRKASPNCELMWTGMDKRLTMYYKQTKTNQSTKQMNTHTHSNSRDLGHLISCSSFCSASLTSICEQVLKMMCMAMIGLLCSWYKENTVSGLNATYWDLNCELHQKYVSPDLPVHRCELMWKQGLCRLDK